MLAQRRAAERAAERDRATAAERERRDREEAAATATHGPHGTEGRYRSGCRCIDCRVDGAPHGTLDRMNEAGCLCGSCVDAAVASKSGYRRQPRTYLYDIDSGRILDHARLVSGRYGLTWAINEPARDESDEDGYGGSVRSGTTWVSAQPKRRDTLVKKGYLEIEADSLVQEYRVAGDWRERRVGRLEQPTVDRFGVALPDQPH